MVEIKHKETRALLCRIDAETLDGADLRGVDLRGANLQRASLHG